MKKFVAIAALATSLAAGSHAQAATLTSGFNPSLLSADTVATRYRGQSTGNEHYVGVNNLGVGANRTEASVNWSPGAYGFTFTYDSATGLISSDLDGQLLTYNGTAGLVSDALQLTLSNRSKASAVFEITDLLVNGESVADLSCSSFCDWMVTDYAVKDTLDVSGTINFSGTMNSNDSERVRFQVTSSAVAPIPLPAPALMLLTALGGTAVIGRRRRKAAKAA